MTDDIPQRDPKMRPIHVATSTQAYETARKNKLRRYPTPDHGGTRLYPLVSPAPNPSFTFSQDDTVFAIGSCFARNLEGALHAAGMNVLSRRPDLGPIGESVGAAGNFLNKYTAPSILNDLKWALERDSFPGEKVIYPISEGVFSDPQMGLGRLTHPLEDILQMRTLYLDKMAEAANADVVIVTLGYVEAWYDTQLDLYLNILPPPQLCKAEPDRFEFRVLGFDDVLGALEDIHALLTKHREKPLKMLITVSPVPLRSTFRDVDILVANTYSKSVQRAAVETFVANRNDVDYFPSYETVSLSNPSVSWSRGDYRHVSPDIVARIMSNVLVNYVPDYAVNGVYNGQPMTKEAVLATARMLIKLGEFAELETVFAQNRVLFGTDDRLLTQIANSIQSTALRLDALGDLVKIAPARPRPLQRLISLSSKQPDMQTRTRALLDLHATRFPNRTAFRTQIEATL